jgi:3-hydroxyisobutyrate dehydrogenase-like beta-hydroxyacid dehydrogenase
MYMKIGFIGLGNMGGGMARNLLRAGHEVAVYNRTREKSEAMVKDGARVADSPADVAQGAEAVMSMLSDDQAVRHILYGDTGLAAGLASGAAHISHSTISTGMARELAAEHAKRGQGYLSVPVFGRPEAAAAKKLVVVPAGPRDLVQRFMPLFEAIGRQTTIAGDEPWQANALKLCGNFMIMSMIEAFGEAYAMLRKSGVDAHRFLDAMNGLFGSPVYANYGKIIADGQYEPAAFALKLGYKDARLVLEAAQECGAPMPLASLNRDHMMQAVAQGQQDQDWSSLARVAARNAGLEV